MNREQRRNEKHNRGPLILPNKYRQREAERRGEKRRIATLIKWVFTDRDIPSKTRDHYTQEIRMFCAKDQDMTDFAIGKIKYYAGDMLSSKELKEIIRVLEMGLD